ncbi:MAG TPA: hypothetical protein VMU77_00905, partial [Acidimicrobiales bacterium]|nr:hypothetical protein [Acidimicrobiales bacterium]
MNEIRPLLGSNLEHRSDDVGVDRLLAGSYSPTSSSEDHFELAEMIGILQAKAATNPDAQTEVPITVMEAFEAISEKGKLPEGVIRPERHFIAKALSVKASVVVASLFLGVGTAAATTGLLPAALQAPMAHVLSDVGISLPTPAVAPPSTTTPPGSSIGTSQVAVLRSQP